MHVFQLTAILMDEARPGFRRVKRNKDGTIGIGREELGIFDSVGKAERVMREYIESRRDDLLIFGFVLCEKRLNDHLYGARDCRWPCPFRTMRTYLADGRLNCSGDVEHWYGHCFGKGAKKEFAGREARTLRVREGDFVYELYEDRIVPALVARLPDSPAEFRAWVKANPLYGRGDECMNYAITDVGHGHVFTPEVFPAFDKIPIWCQRRILAHKKREEADVARRALNRENLLGRC